MTEIPYEKLCGLANIPLPEPEDVGCETEAEWDALPNGEKIRRQNIWYESQMAYKTEEERAAILKKLLKLQTRKERMSAYKAYVGR